MIGLSVTCESCGFGTSECVVHPNFYLCNFCETKGAVYLANSGAIRKNQSQTKRLVELGLVHDSYVSGCFIAVIEEPHIHIHWYSPYTRIETGKSFPAVYGSDACYLGIAMMAGFVDRWLPFSSNTTVVPLKDVEVFVFSKEGLL